MEEEFLDNVSQQQSPAKAVRLIFEYEGKNVRLISQTPVDMVVTGADIAHSEHADYFVDTRDEGNNTLARVSAHGAFASSAEVFPEKHGEQITRVNITHPKGAFTVIAPAPEGTHHVTVLKIDKKISPGGGEGASLSPGSASIQDLASFPITITNPQNEEGQL